MNKLECGKIMAIIKIQYPAFYSKSNDYATIKSAIEIMSLVLEDVDYGLAKISLIKYLSESHEFPPNAGQLREIAKKLDSPYSVTKIFNGHLLCHEEIPIIRKYLIYKYMEKHGKKLNDSENMQFQKLLEQ